MITFTLAMLGSSVVVLGVGLMTALYCWLISSK